MLLLLLCAYAGINFLALTSPELVQHYVPIGTCKQKEQKKLDASLSSTKKWEKQKKMTTQYDVNLPAEPSSSKTAVSIILFTEADVT